MTPDRISDNYFSIFLLVNYVYYSYPVSQCVIIIYTTHFFLFILKIGSSTLNVYILNCYFYRELTSFFNSSKSYTD